MEIKVSQLKASADDKGVITGRASVFGNVDSHGDVVMPGAFSKHLRERGNTIKVLVQHNPEDVIGLATLSEKEDGLHFVAKLALDLPSAKEMYTRVKHGLIDGVSIGYEVESGGATFNKQGIRELHDLKLWEISLVTWPSNASAAVTNVKVRGNAIIAALAAGSRSLKSDTVDLQAVSGALDMLIKQERIEQTEDALDSLGTRIARLAERLR